MICRTVNATAILTDRRVTVTPSLTAVEAEGTLTDRIVSVEAEIVRSVIETEAEIVRSVIETEAEVSGDIEAEAEIVTTVHSSGEYSPYSGETEITPTQDIQTLNTAGKFLAKNITVKPIPTNYGLIAWNGAVLTVS